MAWHKITHIDTGEIQFVAGLEGIDLDSYEAVALVDDRCPEGLEDVDDDGNIFVPLERLQADMWTIVKAKRDLLEDGIAPTPFGAAQCDDRSKIKISGIVNKALIAMSTGTPMNESFTMADNSVVQLNATDALVFGSAVADYISAVFAHARNLREAIFAADATVETLEGLDIFTGWPS